LIHFISLTYLSTLPNTTLSDCHQISIFNVGTIFYSITTPLSPTRLSILHQPLIDVESMDFRVFARKSVRESCIRSPQTRRTPLQTRARSPKIPSVFPIPTPCHYTNSTQRLYFINSSYDFYLTIHLHLIIVVPLFCSI
jgi:hypothetical protein